MKPGKIIPMLIVAAVALYFLVFLGLFLRAVLQAMGVHSLWPVFVFELLVVIAILVKVFKHAAKRANARAREAEPGPRSVDFMTNRTVTKKRPGLNKPTPAHKLANVKDFEETTINGVVWRYRKARRRVAVLGAFCSKCGHALTAVNAAQSWQADLKCFNCGKSFVSMPYDDSNGGTRSFSETKKLAAQIISSKYENATP